jgi:pyrroline-5-carboxylate reductase
MKIGFIGGGTMAEGIIGAILQAGDASADEIAVGEPVLERRQLLADACRVQVTADNPKAVAGADIVVFAVKPNQFPAAAADLKGQLGSDQTVLSIMAGVTIAKLQAALDHKAVVRAMPNPPAQIGEGVCAWIATPQVGEDARADIRRLLAATGKEIAFDDERFIDIATAVSGSGAGFVFLLIEAFIDGAVHLGLPRATATEMVVQTFLGSARLAEQSGRTAAELRGLTTTPGGTTAEGLLVLEEAGLRAAVTEALIATYEKSKALGG